MHDARHKYKYVHSCIPYLRYFVAIQNTHICIHFKVCARMDVQPSLQDAACLEDHARACEPRRRDIALYDNAPYTRSARDGVARRCAGLRLGHRTLLPGQGGLGEKCLRRTEHVGMSNLFARGFDIVEPASRTCIPANLTVGRARRAAGSTRTCQQRSLVPAHRTISTRWFTRAYLLQSSRRGAPCL